MLLSCIICNSKLMISVLCISYTTVVLWLFSVVNNKIKFIKKKLQILGLMNVSSNYLLTFYFSGVQYVV